MLFASRSRPPAASDPLRLSLCLIGSALLFAAAFAPRERAGSSARVRRVRYLMGTILEIDAVGCGAASTEAAVGAAFAAVADVEARLSNWRADSELSCVNASLGGAPLPLSPETFASLAAAFDLARETGGTFDPTVGALTETLGLTGKAPDPARTPVARGRIGWQRCRLDAGRRTIASPVHTVIDSGAFGKGEALDKAVAALRRGGAVAARLNFGGQISVFGTAATAGRRFAEVGLAAPKAYGGEVARFLVSDGSISTSGDAEKPGHLIDPRTGRAAAFHGSVTVVAETGLRADALSTALFVMGPGHGIAFADERGIAALYVLSSGERYQFRASRAFPRIARQTF